jgi:hypothetical protein
MPRKPLLNECQSLFAAPVGRLPLSKYFLHVLHRCVPGFGPFAINVALVVAAAIFIERPTQPTITIAVSGELQRGQAGSRNVSK